MWQDSWPYCWVEYSAANRRKWDWIIDRRITARFSFSSSTQGRGRCYSKESTDAVYDPICSRRNWEALTEWTRWKGSWRTLTSRVRIRKRPQKSTARSKPQAFRYTAYFNNSNNEITTELVTRSPHVRKVLEDGSWERSRVRFGYKPASSQLEPHHAETKFFADEEHIVWPNFLPRTCYL